MSAWTDWVHRVTKGATSREVAAVIGHSHTTALRWMSDRATPEQVIALAVAYRADVIEALVAAGWLAADEVENVNVDVVLRKLSAVKLTGELHRRAVALERTKHPNGDDLWELRRPE